MSCFSIVGFRCSSTISLHSTNLIGILGGVGPLAGVLLHEKIVKGTKAKSDQDHFDIVHMCLPQYVSDRTDYLLAVADDSKQATLPNPALGLPSFLLTEPSSLYILCPIGRNGQSGEIA